MSKTSNMIARLRRQLIPNNRWRRGIGPYVPQEAFFDPADAWEADFDGEDEDEPDLYQCMGCGHCQEHGDPCDMCTGWSMEGIWF